MYTGVGLCECCPRVHVNLHMHTLIHTRAEVSGEFQRGAVPVACMYVYVQVHTHIVSRAKMRVCKNLGNHKRCTFLRKESDLGKHYLDTNYPVAHGWQSYFSFKVQVECREGTRACSAIAKTLVLRSSAK